MVSARAVRTHVLIFSDQPAVFGYGDTPQSLISLRSPVGPDIRLDLSTAHPIAEQGDMTNREAIFQ
jgi:hypothetical protein